MQLGVPTSRQLSFSYIVYAVRSDGVNKKHNFSIHHQLQ